MWYLIIKFARILVIAVHTRRWFARLIRFLSNIGHWVAEWFSSPLIVRASRSLVRWSMVWNSNRITHSAREWWAIVWTDDRLMLSKNCTFIILFEFSPIYTICSLGTVCGRRRYYCGRCSVYGVAPTVTDVDWLVTTLDSARASILWLQIMMNFHFLMCCVLSGLVHIRLMRVNILFVSLWWLWLKWAKSVGREATNGLDVILNLWSNLIISDERATDGSLGVSFLVLALAFALISLSKLILRRVIVLHILNILVFVHCEGRDGVDRNLTILNISSRVSRGFWCCIGRTRIAGSRLPVRSNELDSSATSLINEIFHERVAPLLATALSHTRIMLRLRCVHLTLTLFPAIF